MLAFWVQWRHLRNRNWAPRRNSLIERLQLCVAVTVACIVGIAVPVSRVQLGYHTLEQVLVGSAVGCVFGLLWARFVMSTLVAEMWPDENAPVWWSELLNDAQTAKYD